MPAWLRGLLVFGLLYLFLTGVGLLSEGIEALGSDVQERLFERVESPIAGLFVGVLATVLVQSSSVTTSTIVGLVATGLVSVESAVPMVMGANIGTSVTNTLASVGSIRRPAEFRRAVGAATVHDFFNVMAVIVLLPVELVTGVLADAAGGLSDALTGGGGASFNSPIKAAVKYPVELVLDALSGLGAEGTFFGILGIIAGLAAIFIGLAYITKNMRAVVADRLEETINRVLGGGSGVVAMAVGLVATVAVQSSSITTSVLVPVAAAGVISLRNVYPITLGANVGTTITALLASLATDAPEALTVALVHTLFNLAGIFLFYVLPFARDVPVRAAEGFAQYVSNDRRMLGVYVIGAFVILPLVGIVIFG